MLKRIAKFALMASMILGTSNAVADDATVIKDTYGFNPVVQDSYLRVGARYVQYFGQLDTGKEGSTAQFKNYGQTNIQFSGNVGGQSVGSAHFFLDMESRSGVQEYEFFDVIARASYVTPVGRLNIGKVTNYMAQIATNPGGGTKGSVGSIGTGWTASAAGYCEDDGIDWMVPLFDNALFLELTMWDTACSSYRTTDIIRSDGMGLGQSDKGSTIAFGGRLKLGPVRLKAGVTEETVDDYSKDTDTAHKNTYSQVSGQLTFGSISVNASSVNTSLKNINKLAMATVLIEKAPTGIQDFMRSEIEDLPDADVTASLIGVGFKMEDLGPGDLNLNYEALSAEDNTAAEIPTLAQAVSLQAEAVKMSLLYTVYISKKIGYQAVYGSNTMTRGTLDAKTKTFVGGSLFGRF